MVRAGGNGALRSPAATLVAALSIGPAAAQAPAEVDLVARNAGPVSIVDLQALLGGSEGIQFQMFDLETSDDFCLDLGYVHERDGEELDTRQGAGICTRAGRHRLIVTAKPAGAERMLVFALNEHDTGFGGSFTYGALALDVPAVPTGWSSSKPQETIYADRAVVVMTWSYGNRQTGPLHTVRITAQLKENPDGAISSGRL